MASIDQQFVEYIVKTLVNNPDKVAVERKIDEKGVLLSLTVAPEDVGRVIGRRGVTAQAIRVLLRALGTKQDARYNLKIVNTDEEGAGVRNSGAESSSDGSESADSSDLGVSGSDSKASDSETVEPAEVEAKEEAPTAEEEDGASALAEKTRAELADYDDLDI